MVRIGINGFGRIGRMCLRAALQNEKVVVVAVNSTSDAPSSAHLLKFDSIHGRLNHEIEADGDTMSVDGRAIKIISDRNQKICHPSCVVSNQR